ncbi:MAG: ATP synthase F1 subunit gamma [Candidatus Eremiobacteraeota bacterium]|nr:ATP synthase F1 subunit gamma [Candidatus Eremiobacteraeota bacterium]MBV9646239.1 ATP synthase F1 subunit gamma [Candidatus Eremiobacteraeota bacterium]
MPSVRDLRDRIRSLKNTQQITKAMKQVAAAKIRRAEIAQRQARPYADALSEMLRDLIASVGTIDHPFMKPGRDGAPRGLIVMTADKGLAGAFNANLIRTAVLAQRTDPNLVFYAIGTKARNALRRLPQQTAYAVPLSAGPKIEAARSVAAKVTDDFTAGRVSEIVLISAQFVSMMSQRPQTRSIVPVVAERRAATTGPRAEVEFAPSPEDVLTRLLPKYLEFTLYSAMLETDAAFFAAQLIAMSNATDNAGKLIDELTLAMNKARQAAITKEMLEIVGGAEALAG